MLRGAIIGFGKIAQTGHLPAYCDQAICSRVQIVAMAEPDPKYRKEAAGKIPNLNLYETIDDLLSNEKVDFVDICTPPAFHPYEIAKCVGQNVHILCEKPFALRLDEAAATAELLEKKTGLVFMCCHQYRYSPIWQRFKDFIDRSHGNLKHLLQFNIYRTQADPGYLSKNPNWRIDPQMSGGGILVDTGIHYLYLVSRMLGRPIYLSAGVFNLKQEDINVEDTAIINIVCEKGIAELTLTWGADRNAENARLTNQSGCISYDGARIELAKAGDSENYPIQQELEIRNHVGLYVSLIEEFLSRIEQGNISCEWIDEAYQSIEVVEACYQSARTGRIVRLDFTTSPPPTPW